MTHEFDRRAERWRAELDAALAGLYGDRADLLADKLVDRARQVWSARSDELLELDRRRLEEPDWYQRPERVGYMAYVERFGGSISGVRSRIPHLRELGVDVLHLLSLLEARVGDDDGGYAVRNARVPDPRLGSPRDLDDLITALRDDGISLCIDFVINHTSDDHEWATRAEDGSAYHRALYRTFPDRSVPDAYEATLPQVFPDMAPGNFTWNEPMERWVWTTFREFQWDLDWSNPDVMTEMFDIALHLANLGVEILRIDAVAFTWKRRGGASQNEPEAHLIAQALRAVLAMTAPATLLLAEAIVGPNDLVGYLGNHRLERRECELAYHNQLMVQSWSMLAAGRADLARVALDRLPTPPERTTWFTYVRCHDDIGWAIGDADAAAVGLSGPAHREFLAAFYRGDFWQSFARGAAFGTNPDTGDERTSGSLAALCGLSAAIADDDHDAIERAIDRFSLLTAISFGYGGIPIIYMGDELAQGDDLSYLDDPDLATDTRWRHRPFFDDQRWAQRLDCDTVTGRVWARMRELVVARGGCPTLHGAARTTTFDTGSLEVFGWHRRHPRVGDFVGVANVGNSAAVVTRWPHHADMSDFVDLLSPGDDRLDLLHPLQVRWLTRPDGYPTIPSPPKENDLSA